MTIEEILQEAQQSYLRIKEAEARMRYGYEHYIDDLQAAYTRQLQDIEEAFSRERQHVQTDYEQQISIAHSHFDQASQDAQTQLAEMTSTYRWAVAPWDASAWDNYAPELEAPTPSCVRIGQFALEGVQEFPPLPALVPFIGNGSLFIASTEDTAAAAQELLQAITLRLVVSSPPNTIRLHLVDPAGHGSTLAAFMNLPPALRGEAISYRPEDIEKLLHAVLDYVADINTNRLRNTYATIEDYNQQTTGVAIPYTLLVLPDFPAGFNDRMIETLMTIARNSRKTGVYILATINPSYPFPRGWELTNLTNLGTLLTFSAPDHLTWDDPEFGQYAVVPDRMPEPQRVNAWFKAIDDALKQASTKVSFSHIAPEAQHWMGKAIDGLTVPIGISGSGEMHFFTLGTGTVHHGLIGGMIGSGKSNILHVIITQLALLYPPEEVVLYLIDFKEGVEFQDYITLPHARAILLETEREFGLSMLQDIVKQMEERGQLLKETGVSNRNDYCRKTGLPMPRIVIIMDEFQVLFAEDDAVAREAARILEDIVRRMRSFGIHLLLSSQSPSMAGMLLNRIYDQMALRIAFQFRSSDDYRNILGDRNDAANQLKQPGEAIYSDDKANTFLRVALLSPDERRHYLERIRKLAMRSYPPPFTFEKRTPAKLEDNPELQKALQKQTKWLQPQDLAEIWLGQPIEIKPATAATLERYPRSNLLIAGNDEAQAYGLLLAALLSLAAQRPPSDASFSVADFTRPNSPFADLFASLKNALPHHSLETAGPRTAEALLAQLHAAVTKRQNGEEEQTISHYFMVAGIHRWRELRSSDPYGGQSEAAKRLYSIAEEGPDLGIHLIMWTDSAASLERNFKRNGAGVFDLRVVSHVSEADSNAFLGSPIAARLEDNRAFFRHEDWEIGRLEKFKPYVVPSREVLQQLLNKIREKATS